METMGKRPWRPEDDALPPEKLVRLGRTPKYKLVKFDFDRKAKGIVVKSIEEVNFMIQLKQNSQMNLMIKRSESGLSRLVWCARCQNWIEWSVADEEGVRDASDAEGVVGPGSLKKCECT